jgi:hypothetical protein
LSTVGTQSLSLSTAGAVSEVLPGSGLRGGLRSSGDKAKPFQNSSGLVGSEVRPIESGGACKHLLRGKPTTANDDVVLMERIGQLAMHALLDSVGLEIELLSRDSKAGHVSYRIL